MSKILNLLIEELMKEDLTLQELQQLAKDISVSEQLIDAIRNSPHIEFESVELVGNKSLNTH